MGVNDAFKQTEVGPLPPDWQVTSLGSLVRSVQYGSSAKSAPNGAFPVLRMGNLQDGRIVWDDLVYTNDRAEFERYRLRRGDVLFNRTNTIDLVGKTSLFDSDREALFAGYLIRVVTDADKLDSRYLNYILNTPVAKRHSLKVLSVAVGQANINGQKLRTYPIPLPPTKDEQEAIAGALADADAWVDSLETLIAKKRQIKQGVMQQLLTGKRRLPGFSDEWPEKRLGELFSVSGGFSASRDQLGAEGVCYLHYGDIHTSGKYFIDVEAERGDIPKLPLSLADAGRSAQLDDGDVVFVDASEDLDGTSKHVVIVNPKGIQFISGLHTIVAKARSNELDHGYRRYCFQTSAVRNQFRFYAVGTKVSGVSKGNIVQIVLLIPSIDEQRAIASILMDIDAELVALEHKLHKAQLVKQGMMQNLLTGKVRLA